MTNVLPEAIARSPLMVGVPGLAPGERVPPLCTVTAPSTVPVPLNVAALATVTALAVPVTDKVPADTVMTPLSVFVFERVSVLEPVLARLLLPLMTPDQAVTAPTCIV